ncbi:tyrosine-type recombinase/integrase [Halapricum desulfuricans]|uniref:XerD/XerC family integrase n=1 Tax=Halapricum desulfuricans TaxID=2841257 RepID=A0A897N137_9EURY|nr:site-specific integrase [Halapricum desulfuricans]QSG06417.1 XerD/XerC family integrase [Halapricum desulfuricans]
MTRIPTVTEPVEARLNSRKLTDYTDYKRKLLNWLSKRGKNPQKRKGYADGTVRNVTYHIDRFYRWKWDRDKTYTISLTPEEADDYLDSLLLSEDDYSDSYVHTAQKCLKRVFNYWNNQRGKNFDYDSEFSFSVNQHAPRDFLTQDERQAIREVSLEYGTVPAPTSVRGEERDRWEAYLAQRFEKPKEDVTDADFDRANGWKIPSLVGASLDAGLRPVEVERASIRWVDTDNGVLRIPKEESSKNEGNWIAALTDRTADALRRWVEERKTYPKYDNTDALWLTRYGNRYQSTSLRGLLHNLCDEAGINYEHRQMSWYSIRHSVGTYMTREEDLAAAQVQLRHKSPRTTMKYDQAPIEDRKDALDGMG